MANVLIFIVLAFLAFAVLVPSHHDPILRPPTLPHDIMRLGSHDSDGDKKGRNGL